MESETCHVMKIFEVFRATDQPYSSEPYRIANSGRNVSSTNKCDCLSHDVKIPREGTPWSS